MHNSQALLALLLLLSAASLSLQQTQVLTYDSDAVQFIVQVERVAIPPAVAPTFLGVGTLITFRHVLTEPVITNNLTIGDFVYRFRGARIGDGIIAQPTRLIIGPVASGFVIGEMAQRVDQQFQFAPMARGVYRLNRFCTMMGFDASAVGPTAQSLVMTPVVVENGTLACGATPPNTQNTICVNGVPNRFPVCRGFQGAPITCDGRTLAGVVLSDNMCAAANPRAIVMPVQYFQQWIDETTNGGRRLAQTSGGVLAIAGAIVCLVWAKALGN